MLKLINNIRILRGALLPVMLLFFTSAADVSVADVAPNVNLQAISSPEPPGAETFSWIKVLQNNEPFHLILIDKTSQTLDVLEYENGGFNRVLATYNCATGSNSGKKKESGDSKTPEGIYFITESFTDNKITIFGKRAFHLDYPNVFDKSENRNGDGIYIHGTNKKLIPQSTNGCITMQNSDLDMLSQFLVGHKTPVVIVNDSRELQKLSVNFTDSNKDNILSLLVPDGISRSDLTVHNLFLISNGDQHVAAGKFTVSDANYPHKTNFSRVYLDKDGHGRWKVSQRVFRAPLVKIEPIRKKIQVARAASLTPQDNKKRPTAISISKNIQIAGAADLNLPENEEELPVISEHMTRAQIINFIEKWRQAWQNKQLDEYIGYYAKNFRQGRKNLSAWRDHKAKLNRRYKKITVSVSDIQIDWQKNGANVLFHQVYKSDKFFADGNKLLVLTYSDEKGWRILRESWRK